jgi:hypothetical protein
LDGLQKSQNFESEHGDTAADDLGPILCISFGGMNTTFLCKI